MGSWVISMRLWAGRSCAHGWGVFFVGGRRKMGGWMMGGYGRYKGG